MNQLKFLTVVSGQTITISKAWLNGYKLDDVNRTTVKNKKESALLLDSKNAVEK
jgi:hypothetical protein